MMKKKLTSLLTALCCTAVISVMPASAIVEIVPDGYGYIDAVTGTWTAIMVETDGTVLTEDMVNTVTNFSSLRTWDSIQTAIQTRKCNIEPGENAYILWLTTPRNEETMKTDSRRLMMELECINSAYVISCTEYSDAVLENGFEVQATVTNLETIVIPELEEFELINCGNGSYLCNLIDSETSEFMNKLNDLESSYEKYLYMAEYADILLEKYPDTFETVTPAVSWEDAGAGADYVAASIWQTAGDPNADGAVDAKDAASILQTAAENGTGAGIAATSATDVNADGEVNAKDAAAVLVYAAEEGAGKTPDWVEILRR